MKRILPSTRDWVMFFIGFLPVLNNLIHNLPFLISDLAYIFEGFCFPIVIFLIGVLTSRYTSALFCSGAALISWTSVYFLVSLLSDSFDRLLFGWDYIFNRAIQFALFTLAVLAVRGLVSLIIYLIHKGGDKTRPEVSAEQKSKQKSVAVNVVLIILCAADIASLYFSFLFNRGMHSVDTVLALMIAAASLLAAFILEFLITLLPASFRFSVCLTIIFNIIFLSSFCLALFVYEFLPINYTMGGTGFTLSVVLFPVLHIAAAVTALIIRNSVSTNKSDES